MKLEDLNKARDINQLIKEYKYFLEVKRKCWGELKITRLETKEIKADEILSGLNIILKPI